MRVCDQDLLSNILYFCVVKRMCLVSSLHGRKSVLKSEVCQIVRYA